MKGNLKVLQLIIGVVVYFNMVADNQYTWGFDVPTGKIKYSITLSPQAKTWYEKGEFLPDGTQWFPFLEMNLTKLN